MKRAVRTVCIITKARDNSLVVLTRELAEWIMRTPRYGSDIGVSVYVDVKLKNSKRFDAAGLVADDPQIEHLLHYWTPELCFTNAERFDLVLTLGGDGTVLFTSWLFQRIVPPVLSFSLGSLGFLTPFRFENFRDDLNLVMGGLESEGHGRADSSSIHMSPPTPKRFSLNDSGSPTPTATNSDIISDAGMRVNLRMRFTCTVFRAIRPATRLGTANPSSTNLSAENSNSTASLLPLPTHQETNTVEVLNELVIDRGPSPYVSNLSLFGDDSLLTVIQADGVIFSTPTGSTAYSLSAGGSLVHPDIPAILLTPICPHTLSFRPMLLNDTMALKVAVPRGSRATAYCSFDGKGRIELRQGDYVTIAASRYPFPTVEAGGRGPGMEWIESVSRTLRWNTREAKQKGWGEQNNKVRDAMGGASLSKRNSRVGESLEEEDDWYDEGGQLDGEGKHEEEEFDIDFDQEESEVGSVKEDSGYGTESPLRRNTLV
jgi:NAD+ kinase